MNRRELKNFIFECYCNFLQDRYRKHLLKEDEKKDRDMVFAENEDVLPDAMTQILAKFPTLRHCLVRLQTEDFKEFVSGIDWISPKPTEFRINLKNGQNFTLKWMGKDFEATISGKKYYLGQLVDFQKALEKLSNLYQEGPMGQDEFEPEEGGREEREFSGGGGPANFPGAERPEESSPEGEEGGEEEGSMEDETIDFESDDAFE